MLLTEFRFFGRRRGRKLRPFQDEIYHRVLPRLAVQLPDEQPPVLDVNTLFADSDAPLNLEIGFGGGEYLFQRSQLFPQQNFIGAEPYENGVAKLLASLTGVWDDAQLDQCNVRLYVDDVRDLLAKLPDNCLDRVDIPFPDPWPKLRHQRRRLINRTLILDLSRLLRAGGQLCIATDHEGYLDAILQLMQHFPNFRWQAGCAEDWRVPWYGIQTRYAEKAEQAGRNGHYLNYIFDDSVSLA